MENVKTTIGKVLKTVILLHLCLFSCKGVSVEVGTNTIENPYEGVDFDSAVRVISTTHEHITSQSALEDYINRGVQALSISNYSPAVPVVPITGFSREYVDWQIGEDDNGQTLYERDNNGRIRTVRVNHEEYKVPVLRKVKKCYTGGFNDFYDKDGIRTNLSDMPQLPNAEHTHYYWPENEGLTATNHINFLGTYWSDVCNGADEIAGLKEYNSENGYTLSSVEIRSIFPLWSFTEMLDSVKNNLAFPGKVFGTINHPGYSGISDRYLDAYMKYGSDVFKGIEIYNNSDTDDVKSANMQFYDRSLIRGYKLWCTAVNDWGNFNPAQSDYPKNRGCNILYVDKTYNSLSPEDRAEMILDAYISGRFSSAGYGNIYLNDVNVINTQLNISFNCIPDRTIVDIDGNRLEGAKSAKLSVDVSDIEHFIRFEAYKDDDFVFTNPFFIRVD